MAEHVWTPAEVEERLRVALVTLGRLPARGLWPAGVKVAWPDFVRAYAEAYGYDPARRPRVLATAHDITAMDEAMGWVARWLSEAEARIAGLPPDALKVVMWRAAGVRWDRIVVLRAEIWGVRTKARGGRSPIPGGNSYPSLTKIHRESLALLAARLNGISGTAPAAGEAEPSRGPQLEEQVVVEFPVGEEGTYGPVHARARKVFVPKKGRRG